MRFKGKSCPVCEYQFDINMPGVDMSEEPFFTHRTGDETIYICSTECMEEYLKQEAVA